MQSRPTADPRKGPVMRAKRRHAEKRGRWSEWLAVAYLILKGYRIAALRHRTPLGEIDIVARKGELAVFIEVKARRDERAGVDAVSAASHRRIRAAADLWVGDQPDYARLSQRFDIIVILPRRWPRHFPDAF